MIEFFVQNLPARIAVLLVIFAIVVIASLSALAALRRRSAVRGELQRLT